MTLRRHVLAFAASALLALPAHAQDFDFDVLYFGSGVATLSSTSDTPNGTSVAVGQSFLWNIAAQNGAYWNVATSGTFFPIMAFQAGPDGRRNGTYTFDLFRNGANVFSLTETSDQSRLHLGTNSVGLLAGLQFDEMRLNYLLNSSRSFEDTEDVLTTIASTLPIFGAPEANRFSPGIDYVTTANVPEPGSLALLGLGLAAVAIRRRRLATA